MNKEEELLQTILYLQNCKTKGDVLELFKEIIEKAKQEERERILKVLKIRMRKINVDIENGYDFKDRLDEVTKLFETFENDKYIKSYIKSNKHKYLTDKELKEK